MDQVSMPAHESKYRACRRAYFEIVSAGCCQESPSTSASRPSVVAPRQPLATSVSMPPRPCSLMLHCLASKSVCFSVSRMPLDISSICTPSFTSTSTGMPCSVPATKRGVPSGRLSGSRISSLPAFGAPILSASATGTNEAVPELTISSRAAASTSMSGISRKLLAPIFDCSRASVIATATAASVSSCSIFKGALTKTLQPTSRDSGASKEQTKLSSLANAALTSASVICGMTCLLRRNRSFLLIITDFSSKQFKASSSTPSLIAVLACSAACLKYLSRMLVTYANSDSPMPELASRTASFTAHCSASLHLLGIACTVNVQTVHPWPPSSSILQSTDSNGEWANRSRTVHMRLSNVSSRMERRKYWRRSLSRSVGCIGRRYVNVSSN
mmetsp:Transcript_12756/g.50938  ORF Transcript_12756/g.50938 Transcript_12756/m.50938 type:complete len:387 (-) Transcript_12756:350-1510(-)